MLCLALVLLSGESVHKLISFLCVWTKCHQSISVLYQLYRIKSPNNTLACECLAHTPHPPSLPQAASSPGPPPSKLSKAYEVPACRCQVSHPSVEASNRKTSQRSEIFRFRKNEHFCAKRGGNQSRLCVLLSRL